MPVNTVYVKKTVFLMEERRKPDSPWIDYIESMPNDWSSFPLFYSNEDYEMLRGSHVFFNMQADEEALYQAYNLLASSIP